MTEEYDNYEEMEAAARRLLEEWDREDQRRSEVEPKEPGSLARGREEQAEISRPLEEPR
jgi:hypothetical protein